MRKYCEENERIKRLHARWLRDAEGRDVTTIDCALSAILKFEQSTGFQNFKRFNLEQPTAFKKMLFKAKNERTGRALSKSTIDGILRHVKKFFKWLAGETGYKSRISYSDAEYFNNNTKDARAAHARRDTPFPTPEQCAHAFRLMPQGYEIEFRNKALFAFLMLTGARDGAIASLKLKHINLIDRSVFQDAREVKTKASKTFTTWFFPVDEMYENCIRDWVNYLRNDKLFGHDDALFPKPEIGIGESGAFKVLGLSKDVYSNGTTICRIIKQSFESAGLPGFGPHSFRKTLARIGDELCIDLKSIKAWSLNLGHDNVAMTIGSYLPISTTEQAELIKGMRKD